MQYITKEFKKHFSRLLFHCRWNTHHHFLCLLRNVYGQKPD